MKSKEQQFFSGKGVVVYGATGGLGEALCAELCGKVGRLVLAGRNKQKLQALQEHLKNVQTGQTIEIWPILPESSICDFAQRIREEQLDGLIIATGKTSYQKFCPPNVGCDSSVEGDSSTSTTEKQNNLALWHEYEEILSVNLHQVLRLAFELLPYFAQRKGFCHIAGSYTCIFPVPYQAVYSASKAALLSFVQAVTRESNETKRHSPHPTLGSQGSPPSHPTLGSQGSHPSHPTLGSEGSHPSKGLLSISLIGGMATNMYYQSDLQKQFGPMERWVISAPERIAKGVLRGIRRKKTIITIRWNGFLIYHLVRRLPASWLGRALERAYRPKK